MKIKNKKSMSKKGGSRQYFEGNRNLLKSKRSMELEMLGWIILGLLALVIVMVAIYFMSKSGSGAIAYIKNLFRFGR